MAVALLETTAVAAPLPRQAEQVTPHSCRRSVFSPSSTRSPTTSRQVMAPLREAVVPPSKAMPQPDEGASARPVKTSGAAGQRP